MTGILGWFDPAGVDAERVRRAGEATSYRGRASVHLIEPRLAVATVGGADHNRSDRSSLFLDGRVFAWLHGHHPAPSLESLRDVLTRDGVEALNAVAGDFALAMVETNPLRVTLARDAFGMRPLYVTWRNRAFAFASEPSMLMATSLANDDLDVEVLSAFLAGKYSLDGRTAFTSIRELAPGTWMGFDCDGRARRGRWIDPDRLVRARLAGSEAVEALQHALAGAVRDRAQGRRAAIALSGGRDSTSVLAAAEMAGITPVAITRTYDDDLPVDETAGARLACRAFDVEWYPARVASHLSDHMEEDLPRWSGGPITLPAAPEAVAVPDAARDLGMDIVLTGDGESLLAASELVCLDLLRAGRLRLAVMSVRSFRSSWGHSYWRQFKVAGRALTPRRTLAWREHRRSIPPWVHGFDLEPSFSSPTSRSDRALLRAELLHPYSMGYSHDERVFRSRGLEFSSPLMDLRVLSVALSVPAEERAPIAEPKPLLSRAFLGDLSTSRVKMSFEPYYDRLSANVQADRPLLFGDGSRAVQRGLIDPRGLWAVATPTWRQHALALMVLEVWLGRRL